MNDDMNFEFELKEAFKREAPPLPETLKKENVIAMSEKEKATPKKKKKRIFLKAVSVAAAFVIVVASVYTLPLIMPEKGLIEAETTTVPVTQQVVHKPLDNGLKATKLMQAESNEDLRNHFLRIYRENMVDDIVDGVFNYGFYMKSENAADGAMPEGDMEIGSAMATTAAALQQESAAAPMAPAVTAAPETTQAGVPLTTVPVAEDVKTTVAAGVTDDALYETTTEEAYGKTNIQVENVDEADIIKNDGKYLYILSGGMYKVERRVTIVSAADMKVVSKIILESDDYYYNIQEMYVNGDRLVLLATETEKVEYDEDDVSTYDMAYYGGYHYGESDIVSFVYDISDRENPSLVRKVTQDGSRYISSRMIDGILYTVSAYWVNGNSEDEIKENSVPEVDGKEVPCDCIYIYDYDSREYIILSAYDTKLDENGTVTSLSLLGSGDEVYCSRDALYVAGWKYDDANGNATEIYSFNLNGTDISYRASGAVKGNILNQFSLDEYEENLRIATTYYSYKHDIDVSSVYVLNKDLQLIGALEDIAYDEQVKSVRFMGDTGYIVTFRNTDPLFTLDLSDPTAPKTVGEVKLPGFSSYLHPVGDGLVVGLGYDGDDESADFSSIKVSLFDVSDLKNPKEVDTFVLKDVYSQALDNPKAFIHYPEENLIGFPVEHYDSTTVLSYKLLKIENRVIESHLGYVHETERLRGDVFRGTYIGQKLYTIDNYNVCEFDIPTAEMLRSCEIIDVDDDAADIDKYKYYEYYGDDIVIYTTPAVPPDAVVATTAVDLDDEADISDDATTTSLPYEKTSAANTATTAAPYLTFEAKVIEANGNTLLVEVTDSLDSLLSVGSQASVNTGGLACKVGDSIKVTFDGVVQETYPLQLPNILSITVLQ